MNSKFIKKLTFGTLLLQVLISTLLVFGMNGFQLALADDTPAAPSTATAPAADKKPISAMSPASMTFSLDHLKADQQEQSYLKSGNPIGSFIIQIVNFLVLTIGSVCFIALVIGGFVLLTSHGNENSVTKGKEIITNALIGLVVVLCAYFITAFVKSLFYELPK